MFKTSAWHSIWGGSASFPTKVLTSRPNAVPDTCDFGRGMGTTSSRILRVLRWTNDLVDAERMMEQRALLVYCFTAVGHRLFIRIAQSASGQQATRPIRAWRLLESHSSASKYVGPEHKIDNPWSEARQNPPGCRLSARFLVLYVFMFFVCFVYVSLMLMCARSIKSCLHFSICACHPSAGAMLIFSVSFQV